MKVMLAAILFTTASVFPTNAATTDEPNLRGYVCVDQKGIHHGWKNAFDGTTFCKLVKNSFYKK